MLIGLAIFLIVGVLFLIIFNIAAMKRSNTNRQQRPAEEAGNDAADIAPEAAQAEAVRPAAETAVPQAGAAAREAAPPEAVPPAAATAGPVRHSDEEYRQALRSFSGHDPAPGQGEANDGRNPEQSKDDAYREALRTLSKRK
ncbi:hypothetical protein SD70_00670 [Gordoniibacillus kamchatkensis]|uniref:Uncharacterized protein n=1 Tax=Gordoniibacillus kamchatkensis TaxID=1590651 RepID=A0ABR5ANA5_9BACL|nr:hypothetical protein [Paenibacillus sp. VKM B-2647]KIL42456.1 hypothetical protein SD70_00670 [Paenibacillus sp. VKM B-2647]